MEGMGPALGIGETWKNRARRNKQERKDSDHH